MEIIIYKKNPSKAVKVLQQKLNTPFDGLKFHPVNVCVKSISFD